MGLKILHTSDWHLDSPFARFSPEQQEFLMGAQRRIPWQISDKVRSEGCDLVLISGDIFDNPVTRKSVPIVREALTRASSGKTRRFHTQLNKWPVTP